MFKKSRKNRIELKTSKVNSPKIRKIVPTFFDRRSNIRTWPKETYWAIRFGLIPPFRVHVRQSQNNVFFTALNPKSKTVYTLSSGTSGMKGGARSTTFAAGQVGRLAGVKLRDLEFGASLCLYKSPVNPHLKLLTRSICQTFRGIKGLCDVIPRSHNGLRGRKLRRV